MVIAGHLPYAGQQLKKFHLEFPTQHEVTRTGIAKGTDMYLYLNLFAPTFLRPAAI